MIGTLAAEVAAAVFFVASHLVLSVAPVREGLAARLGERPYQALHGVVSMAALLWLVFAFRAAPTVPLWAQAPWTRWVPNLVMPVAMILLACGLTTRHGAVGARGGHPPPPGARPAPGILAITRHPNLWAAGLWALAHLAPNGDAAAVILFLAVATLSFAGMPLVSLRRRRTYGAAWGPVELASSIVPFAALIAGRAHLRWSEIGMARILSGIVLYLGALLLHPVLIGVSPLPL